MSRLGSFLTQEGLLSLTDRQLIRRESASHNGSFARSVLAMGLLNEEELSELLAVKTSFRRAAKDIFHEMDREVSQIAPAHILAWLEVLPLAVKDGVLSLAMVDPTDLDAQNQIRFFTGLRVRPVIATRSEILRGLNSIGAVLPTESSPFETFIRTHGKQESFVGTTTEVVSPTIGADVGRGAPERKVVSRGHEVRDLGIDLVQQTVPTGSSASGQRGEKEFNTRGETEEQKSSPVGSHRLTSNGRTRTSQGEISVAVQAGISILNRFTMKLQLATTLDDALQKFIEAAMKAGVRNGVLIRLLGDSVDFGAHWRDSGLDVTSGLNIPSDINVQALLPALTMRMGEQSWKHVDEVYGANAEAILKFWADASATPESVFVITRDDWGLLCLASFSHEYDHDGLRQIFSDALQNLSSRL